MSKHRFLVLALGMNCTIGYGTVFYAFSLLSLQLQQAFAWSHEFIYGVYSLGILLSGLASPVIGRYLDQWGARYLMSAGSLIVGLSFLGLSSIESRSEYIVYLLLMEVFSILVLYESAFVALAHAKGQQARLAITHITLMAGFASTIFWPLVSWLLAVSDWRTTYVILGLLHLFICLPLHFFLLKTVRYQQHTDQVKVVNGESSASYYWLEFMIALAFGCIAFCITGLQTHLFGMMSELNIAQGLAIFAATLIGPSQVVSRIADMYLGQRLNPLILALLSILSMVFGVLFLLGGHIEPYFILLFALAFGLGQGLTSIVRGAVPLFLFGEGNYGAITGRMNGVRIAMTAIAPLSLALVLEHFGAIYGASLLFMGMLMSALLLYVVNRASKPLLLRP